MQTFMEKNMTASSLVCGEQIAPYVSSRLDYLYFYIVLSYDCSSSVLSHIEIQKLSFSVSSSLDSGLRDCLILCLDLNNVPPGT